MRRHQSITELIELLQEITDGGKTTEIPEEEFMGRLMYRIGLDYRKVTPALQFYRGLGLIKNEGRGGKTFIVIDEKKLLAEA